MPYDDTPEIIDMRTRLERYNALLARTFIDIPYLEEPVIVIPPKPKSKTGKPTRVSISPSRKFVRRIFYRGSFRLGGRFHGGWWQQIGSDDRARIYIDDEDTFEIDYAGLHVAILYSLEGRAMPDDPYELPPLFNVSSGQQRKWVKLLVLTAINADTEDKAIRAFLDEIKEDESEMEIGYRQTKIFLDAFKDKNADIKHKLGSDAGVSLMNLDGRIAAYVIDAFTNEDIPVLCTHDSFTVQAKHAKKLADTMIKAYMEVLGVVSKSIQEPKMKISSHNDEILKEMTFDKALKTAELLSSLGRSQCSSEQYIKRMLEFEGWLQSQGITSELKAERAWEAYEEIYVYRSYL